MVSSEVNKYIYIHKKDDCVTCKLQDKMFQVSEETRKRAAEMFGRDEESLTQDVETIRNWIKTQPHLPEIMEDVKIRNFLLLNKCSVEKTKQKIDMYYTIRSLIPQLYEDSNPKLPHMKNLMEHTYCFPLPKLVNDMYRVYFLKTKDFNKYAPRESSMQFANITEMRLYEDCMIGDIYIFDMSKISFTDLTKVTPMLALNVFTMYEKVYSLRIKAMYFINSPSYISKLTTLLKSILKSKIFDRIQVYEDQKILNEILSKEDLPVDYGGNGLSLDQLNEMMKKKLSEYQNRFDKLDKLRVNEHLRPEKLENDDVLGFHGNFKKFTVD